MNTVPSTTNKHKFYACENARPTLIYVDQISLFSVKQKPTASFHTKQAHLSKTYGIWINIKQE